MQDTCVQPDKLAFVARRGRRTLFVIRQWQWRCDTQLLSREGHIRLSSSVNVCGSDLVGARQTSLVLSGDGSDLVGARLTSLVLVSFATSCRSIVVVVLVLAVDRRFIVTRRRCRCCCLGSSTSDALDACNSGRSSSSDSLPELYFTRLENAGHTKWYYFYHAVLTLLTIYKSLLFMQIVN